MVVQNPPHELLSTDVVYRICNTCEAADVTIPHLPSRSLSRHEPSPSICMVHQGARLTQADSGREAEMVCRWSVW